MLSTSSIPQTQHLALCADVRYCTMSELGSGKGAISGCVNKPGGWKPRGLGHARPHTLMQSSGLLSNMLISVANPAIPDDESSNKHVV